MLAHLKRRDSVLRRGSDRLQQFWTEQPFHLRVLTGGLALYAVLLAFVGVVFAIGGQTDSLVPGFVFAFLTILVAGAALTVGRWTLTFAAVWALLNLMVQSALRMPVFIHFNSVVDFGFGMAILISVLAATAAGGMLFMDRHGGGPPPEEGTPGERKWLRRAAKGVLALIVVSGFLHVISLDSVSAEERQGAIVIEIRNDHFFPDEIVVEAGEPVTIVVENHDFGVHTFTLPQITFGVIIIGGSERLITLPPLAAGTLRYACEIPGHEDQRGTLTVRAES